MGFNEGVAVIKVMDSGLGRFSGKSNQTKLPAIKYYRATVAIRTMLKSPIGAL
jgi:hypothetical protein